MAKKENNSNEETKKTKSLGYAPTVVNEGNLHELESKFFNDNKNLKNHFNIYSEQAKRVYSMAVDLVGDSPDLFDRFSHIYFTFDPLAEEYQGVSRYKFNSHNINTVEISPYLDSEQYFVDVPNFNEDIDTSKLTPQELEKVLEKQKTTNNREIECLQLSRETFFNYPNNIQLTNTEQTNLTDEELKQQKKQTKIRTAVEMISNRKTFYHEIWHSISSKKEQKATEIADLPDKYKLPENNVLYSNNLIKSVYTIVDNEVYVLKKYSPAYYLEEGIVEGLAIDCLADEVFNTSDARIKGIKKSSLITYSIENSPYKTMLALTEMCNAVTNNELRKKHLTNKISNQDFKNKVYKFEDEFGKFIYFLTDDNYRSQVKSFEENNINNILNSYFNCIKTCKNYYEQERMDDNPNLNSEKYEIFYKYATEPEYIFNDLYQHIIFTNEEQEETMQKINKCVEFLNTGILNGEYHNSKEDFYINFNNIEIQDSKQAITQQQNNTNFETNINQNVNLTAKNDHIPAQNNNLVANNQHFKKNNDTSINQNNTEIYEQNSVTNLNNYNSDNTNFLNEYPQYENNLELQKQYYIPVRKKIFAKDIVKRTQEVQQAQQSKNPNLTNKDELTK